MEDLSFNYLKGKTITSIEGAERNSKEVLIRLNNGDTFQMYHRQGCCENVYLEEVIGDINDLIGEPLLEAEEISSRDPIEDSKQLQPYYRENIFSWTFYKLGTKKGFVTLRWYGESNGYYSIGVSFVKIS